MNTLSAVLVALVMLEHVYIMVIEMFLWTKPQGLKAFNLTPEFAQATKALAANQGLYNGFLAAGLLWGLLSNRFDLQLFFVACVVVAALYGGFTVNKSVWVKQGAPAVVALIVLLITRA